MGGALSILSRKTRPVWIPDQGRHTVHDRRANSEERAAHARGVSTRKGRRPGVVDATKLA